MGTLRHPSPPGLHTSTLLFSLLLCLFVVHASRQNGGLPEEGADYSIQLKIGAIHPLQRHDLSSRAHAFHLESVLQATDHKGKRRGELRF